MMNDYKAISELQYEGVFSSGTLFNLFGTISDVSSQTPCPLVMCHYSFSIAMWSIFMYSDLDMSDFVVDSQD